MLSQINSKAIAISIDERSYSYEELANLVEKQSKELENPLILKSDFSIDFISKLLAGLESKIPTVVLPENYNEEVEFKNVDFHPECALVLLTSGSSGKSKFVQLSKANINANIKAISLCLDFNQIESQVLFLPLSYSYGLIGQLLTGLALGKTTYVSNHFIKVKKIVESHNVNMISGVPTHFPPLIKLLNSNTSISHVISAGAYLAKDLREKLAKAFPKAVIYNNYGQTEMGPRALCMNSKDKFFFTNATGYPVKGIEFRINDEMIEFKGEQVMLGYLDANSPIDNDGWLRTGDRATSNGNLVTIKGRDDDLVQIDGKRISLLKLKDDIIKILSKSDVAVIQDNDQRVFCFMTETLSRAEHSHLLDKLDVTLPFNHFIQIDEIPLLMSGKLDKSQLKSFIKKN